MKLLHVIFAVATSYFSFFLFFFFLNSSSAGFCCQTALCSLLCQLTSDRRPAVEDFGGKDDCSDAKYEKTRDSCNIFFPFFFSTFFVFFLLKLDKYRTCWFVHATSGFKSPSQCIFVALLELGTRTCSGPVASLAGA